MKYYFSPNLEKWTRKQIPTDAPVKDTFIESKDGLTIHVEVYMNDDEDKYEIVDVVLNQDEDWVAASAWALETENNWEKTYKDHVDTLLDYSGGYESVDDIIRRAKRLVKEQSPVDTPKKSSVTNKPLTETVTQRVQRGHRLLDMWSKRKK